MFFSTLLLSCAHAPPEPPMPPLPPPGFTEWGCLNLAYGDGPCPCRYLWQSEDEGQTMTPVYKR